MTDTIYFLLAVAATAAVIFALPTRADRGRRDSGWSGGDSARGARGGNND